MTDDIDLPARTPAEWYALIIDVLADVPEQDRIDVMRRAYAKMKRAYSCLACERPCFNALAHLSERGMMVVVNGKVVRANPVAAAMLRWKPEELEGTRLDQHVGAPDVGELLHETYRRGSAIRPELRLVRRDGSFAWAAVSACCTTLGPRPVLLLHLAKLQRTWTEEKRSADLFRRQRVIE